MFKQQGKRGEVGSREEVGAGEEGVEEVPVAPFPVVGAAIRLVWVAKMTSSAETRSSALLLMHL